MTLYRSIIRQAFTIAWQHKYLWFFGLFATLLTSNFELELVNRFINRSFTIYDWQRWQATGIFQAQFWSNLGDIARTQPWSFASIILVGLILLAMIIALVWLSIVSQVALVSNTNKALGGNGKKLTIAERRHDTSVGFQEGKRNFWTVLWLNLLVRLVVYGLALITLVPLISSSGQSVGANLAYLVVFIVFLAIALTLSLIARFAIAAVVLKQQTWQHAISSSWELFWNNWLVSLEMAFILFAVSILSTFAIIISVFIIAIPAALLYLASLTLGSYVLFIMVLVVAILASLGAVIIGGAIVTVVQITGWVAFYNQLTGKGAESKLQRIFN